MASRLKDPASEVIDLIVPATIHDRQSLIRGGLSIGGPGISPVERSTVLRI